MKIVQSVNAFYKYFVDSRKTVTFEPAPIVPKKCYVIVVKAFGGKCKFFNLRIFCRVFPIGDLSRHTHLLNLHSG